LRLLFHKLFVISVMLALPAGLCLAQTSAPSTKSSHHTTGKRRHRSRKTSWKNKGQKGIQPARVTEIQQALIREKYLTGEANGVWDARTQAALVRYQSDNGWQSKVVPDSRALIKLGLGPDYTSQKTVTTESKADGDGLLPNANSPRAAAGSTANRDKQ
jgi:hypothetical protein